MSDQFIGQLKIFAGNFAPLGWAFCSGQLLPIDQNSALFALIGTIYGGDGMTTFALPNLQGRVPVHQGQGPGFTNRVIGQTGGTESVTLSVNQIPAHTHSQITPPASSLPATHTEPAGHVFAVPIDGSAAYSNSSNATLNGGGNLPIEGGGQPHNNLQPYLCVNFIIALQGIFPSRN